MNYNFDNIAGYNTEKEELARLCEIFNNRQVYESKGAKLPKGIIFYGESGTGKTLFAKVMANVCNLNTINIDLGNADTDTEICKRIRRAFASATKSKTATMIFFDEIDKVLPNYRENYVTDRSKTILAQLLTLIDGMNSSGNVVFVATCNYYGNLPETLVRAGRIDKKINIGKPSYSSRVEILSMYAKRSNCKFDVTMETLAKLSAGFSCAELETLINECILQCDENGSISEQLVKERVLEIKNEDIPRRETTVADRALACSNIGSYVVACMFSDGDYLLNLDRYTTCNFFFNMVMNQFDSDYDVEKDIDFSDCEDDDYDDCDDYDDEDEYDEENDDDDDTNDIYYFSKEDYVNAICVLMGKIVVQEVVFGRTYDNNYSAIKLIDEILFSMSEYGLLGLDLVYIEKHDRMLGYSSEFRGRLTEEFDRIKSYCYNKAKAIVTANEDLIRKLLPILAEKQMIDRDALKPLLSELGGIKYVN